MVSPVAPLAFLLVGTGTALACVALILPQWVTISQPGVSYPVRVGFWQICNGTACEHFLKPDPFSDPTLVALGVTSTWLRPIEALYCLGILGSLFAFIMGMMYLCSPLFRLCTPVSMIGLVLSSSFGCQAVAGAVFGLKVADTKKFMEAGAFSWALYFGVGGAACILLATIMYCEVLACTKQPRFERLQEEKDPKAKNKKQKQHKKEKAHNNHTN